MAINTTITDLPTPPQSTDRITFDARARAFIDAQHDTYTGEMNDVVHDINTTKDAINTTCGDLPRDTINDSQILDYAAYSSDKSEDMFSAVVGNIPNWRKTEKFPWYDVGSTNVMTPFDQIKIKTEKTEKNSFFDIEFSVMLNAGCAIGSDCFFAGTLMVSTDYGASWSEFDFPVKEDGGFGISGVLNGGYSNIGYTGPVWFCAGYKSITNGVQARISSNGFLRVVEVSTATI